MKKYLGDLPVRDSKAFSEIPKTKKDKEKDDNKSINLNSCTEKDDFNKRKLVTATSTNEQSFDDFKKFKNGAINEDLNSPS